MYLCVPAIDVVLRAFTALFAGQSAATSVRNKVSAIKARQIVHDAPWLAGTQLSTILNSVNNLAPSHACQPKYAAVWAIATTAFWGQCCLGELLSTTRPRFGALGSLHIHPSTCTHPTQLHLPWTKAAGRAGVTIPLPSQFGPSNLAHALRSHFIINPPTPSIPLFYFERNGIKEASLQSATGYGAMQTFHAYPDTLFASEEPLNS